MLVLRRSVEEEVIITVPPSTEAQTVVVKVTGISKEPESNGTVSLGFIAERQVSIVRDDARRRL